MFSFAFEFCVAGPPFARGGAQRRPGQKGTLFFLGGGRAGTKGAFFQKAAFAPPGPRRVRYQSLVMSTRSSSAVSMSSSRQLTKASAVSMEVKQGMERSTALRRILTLSSEGMRPLVSVEMT